MDLRLDSLAPVQQAHVRFVVTGLGSQTPADVKLRVLAANSGAVTAGSWVEIPLAGLVTGDGTYDLVLKPLSTTALRLDSRESPTAPELVITR